MYATELQVAKRIAKRAGTIIRTYFNELHTGDHSFKADGTPVTVADKEVNELVIRIISRYFDDGIVGEEQSTIGLGMGRRWFCDPLDGTKAFTWGAPTALFSLGLVVDGRPVLGVIYDPFLDRLFEAVVGEGSYCNGRQLRVSTRQLAGGHVAISNNIEKLTTDPRCLNKLHEYGALPTSFSGATYRACLVAQAQFVGYFDPGIRAHDIAAAQIIIEEAGGSVTGYAGDRLDYSAAFKGAVISNKIVHQRLLHCAELFT